MRGVQTARLLQLAPEMVYPLDVREVLQSVCWWMRPGHTPYRRLSRGGRGESGEATVASTVIFHHQAEATGRLLRPWLGLRRVKRDHMTITSRAGGPSVLFESNFMTCGMCWLLLLMLTILHDR